MTVVYKYAKNHKKQEEWRATKATITNMHKLNDYICVSNTGATLWKYTKFK